MKIDHWVWGDEQILWGFDPTHRYTLKVLCPKPGRAGCLSLQSHREKSESWVCLSGVAWALVVVDGVVATTVLRPGDVLTLPTGTIHRLGAVVTGTQVLEPSTPDRHAADPSVPKDVRRLHCVHGRPVDPPKNELEREIIERAAEITEEALAAIERGAEPPEHHRELIPFRAKLSLANHGS